ncbi:hypothetical protein P167DRAFT_543368 [Morchella conica CCBAS932]|uniref:Uncharacterized protein n=1 Tax=Morchella conica CCBAS932 TaxID=1392247 RepID=A0A3N4L0N0_9PEZI|nr:hypothetical protein P167DRAFT_543368 [Morchella conica CCBAS932]
MYIPVPLPRPYLKPFFESNIDNLRISGITNRTGLEYHLPIGQDDQKLRFGFVGLRLNKHLTNPKQNIPVQFDSLFLRFCGIPLCMPRRLEYSANMHAWCLNKYHAASWLVFEYGARRHEALKLLRLVMIIQDR